ncbi:MAG: flavodoxin-dependent (E)-4-hydroxy-3-methylbut-2-enyl-diphosphate synthase [Candidatus Omnitrophica bacterium]|nr:flavodoxin-dependent (E)-4-hydroxy-3-methylbut-2-enyl-diphosphate synthase [Candidatus Omnitrophota bacterium]
MRTRQVNIGKVKIGGNAPVSIQSMAKTETSNVAATAKQINCLAQAGCEIIRVAVKDRAQALALGKIKSRISIPIVADIHFNKELALCAIEQGVDAIRINPGNMNRPDDIKSVIKAAKKRHLPIRIGVNSGSCPRISRDLATSMVSLAMRTVRFFEKERLRDIIISLKASDVPTTVKAYRKMRKSCNYPFHLGITAAGTKLNAAIKSAAGIGSLLLDGIGDTIRVSVTGDPVEEVEIAKSMLQSLGLRRFGPEIISCPTCGRCEVDLLKIVTAVEKKICGRRNKNLRIAIMGCIVNGPGEARDADIGIAAGKGCGILFKKGKKIRKIKEKDFVTTLLKEIT